MQDEGKALANDFHFNRGSQLEDIIAGNLAGWAYVTVGQPLDYLKIQYQIHSKLPPLRQTYSQIGFMGFYKGASSIYSFIGVITAVQFYCFEVFCNYLSQMGFTDEKKQRSTSNLVISGFLTGAVAAMIYTPIEYAKIHSQISKTSKQGSLSRIIQIIYHERLMGIKKLYTGSFLSITKQSFGSALYFGGYHVMMSKLLGYEREKAPIAAQMGIGCISGFLYQFFSFPFDMIKTNVQSGKKTAKEMMKSKFWQASNFRQGFKISLLRSILTDSTNFLVYENVRNFLLKKNLYSYF